MADRTASAVRWAEESRPLRRIVELGMIIVAFVAAGCVDHPSGPDSLNGASADAAVTPVANATVAWNGISRQLVVKENTGAAAAVRVYALLSVAQYNAAVAAAAGRREAASDSPSITAAVTAASAGVLAYLYPDELPSLEAKVAEVAGRLESLGDAESFASGEEIGRAAAEEVIAWADEDRYFAPFIGTIPQCPGCWTPTTIPVPFGGMGNARTYFLESGDQFRPPPPPPFDSDQFRTDLRQLQQIAASRTVRQDSIAKAWELPVGTVTPQGYWNEEAAALVVDNRLTERAAARVFALMNIAGYEALVAAQEAKFAYWVLRPNQADTTLVLATGQPGSPSYPSNLAATSRAIATVLGAMFPEDRRRLERAAEEAGISRLFGGIHYRFDMRAGMHLGRQVGTLVLARAPAEREPIALRFD